MYSALTSVANFSKLLRFSTRLVQTDRQTCMEQLPVMRKWTSVYSSTMKGAVLLLLVAVLVRLLLLWQRSHEWLGQRIEISTPINQWKRSQSELYALSYHVTCTLIIIFMEGRITPQTLHLLNFLFTHCSKGRNSTLRRRTLTLRRGHISWGHNILHTLVKLFIIHVPVYMSMWHIESEPLHE